MKNKKVETKINLLRKAIINIENYLSELEENDIKREEINEIIDSLELLKEKEEIFNVSKLVNKVIGGTVEIKSNQCRIIFNAKNKKEIMKHFLISQNRFKDYFTETSNKEEVDLIQGNPTKIFYKLAFDYSDVFKEFNIEDAK